MLELDLNC